MDALLKKGADPNVRISTHPWYLVYNDCGNATAVSRHVGLDGVLARGVRHGRSTR